MADKKGFKILTGLVIGAAVIVAAAAFFMWDTTGRKGSGLDNKYEYDIRELTKVEESLILYEQQEQPVSTGFKTAKGIAVKSEVVYVIGDKAVHKYSLALLPIDTVELDDSPTCITADDDGLMYLGIGGHVEVYDAAGVRLASWKQAGEKAVLTSIAVYKDNVFAADAANRIVLRYDRNGNLINRIGDKNTDGNVPGFVVPSPYFDLAVAKDGLLRVTNPGRLLIEAYTFEGDREFFWGGASAGIEGFCGCCNPVNFALLPDGSFVTVEKGLVRVKIYDADGGFVGVVAGPEQLLGDSSARAGESVTQARMSGFDVAVGEDGRIYVLDSIQNQVRIFVRKRSF